MHKEHWEAFENTETCKENPVFLIYPDAHVKGLTFSLHDKHDPYDREGMIKYVKEHGEKNWKHVAELFGYACADSARQSYNELIGRR